MHRKLDKKSCTENKRLNQRAQRHSNNRSVSLESDEYKLWLEKSCSFLLRVQLKESSLGFHEDCHLIFTSVLNWSMPTRKIGLPTFLGKQIPFSQSLRRRYLVTRKPKGYNRLQTSYNRKCEIKHWYACVADGRAGGVRQGWGWSTSPMAPGASFVYLLSSLVPRRSVLIRCPREVWERAGERTAFSASISRWRHSSW